MLPDEWLAPLISLTSDTSALSLLSQAAGSDAIWGLGGESWASSRCAVEYMRKKTAGEASSSWDETAAEDAGLAVNPEIPVSLQWLN